MINVTDIRIRQISRILAEKQEETIDDSLQRTIEENKKKREKLEKDRAEYNRQITRNIRKPGNNKPAG